MTLVKITLKTPTKVYVSTELAGHGSTNSNFDVSKTSLQVLPENFPGFKGTSEEWDVIMESTIEIRKELIGHT